MYQVGDVLHVKFQIIFEDTVPLGRDVYYYLYHLIEELKPDDKGEVYFRAQEMTEKEITSTIVLIQQGEFFNQTDAFFDVEKVPFDVWAVNVMRGYYIPTSSYKEEV